MEYIIRKMSAAEYPLLNDFLYEAIFIPDGAEPPPQQVNRQRLEFYGVHPGALHTNPGRASAYGDENPQMFNPTRATERTPTPLVPWR